MQALNDPAAPEKTELLNGQSAERADTELVAPVAAAHEPAELADARRHGRLRDEIERGQSPMGEMQ